jgi:hypothetical protein
MKKKIVLIAIEKAAMDKYLQNLKDFFNNDIDIEGCYVAGHTLPARIDGDLVLLTSLDLTSTVRKYIKENINILYLDRTFNQRKSGRLSEEACGRQNAACRLYGTDSQKDDFAYH